ncbi:hypothetical protein ACR3K2_38400 [Cryptosporidium serpentis]
MFNFYSNFKSLKLFVVIYISVIILYKDLKYNELSSDYKPFNIKNYFGYSNLEIKARKHRSNKKRVKKSPKKSYGVKTHRLKRMPNKKKKYYPKKLLKFIYSKIFNKENKGRNKAGKENKASKDIPTDVLVKEVPNLCRNEVDELNKVLQIDLESPDISLELIQIEKSISEEECTVELLNYLRDFIVLLFNRKVILESTVDENRHDSCQHDHSSSSHICDLCRTKQKLLRDLRERRNNVSESIEAIVKIMKECTHIINKYDMVNYQYKKHDDVNEEECSEDDFLRLVKEYDELIVHEYLNKSFYEYHKQTLNKCVECKSGTLVSNICKVCTSINNSKSNLYKRAGIIEIDIQEKLTQIFQCENYLFNLMNENTLRRKWLKKMHTKESQEIEANNQETSSQVLLESQNTPVLGNSRDFGASTRKLFSDLFSDFFSDISAIFKRKEKDRKIALEKQLEAKLESMRNKAEIERQTRIKRNLELEQGVCTEDNLKYFLEGRNKYLKCFHHSLTSLVRCHIRCNEKNCYFCEQETILKRNRCFYKLQEIKEKLILCLRINGWTPEDIKEELKDILDAEQENKKILSMAEKSSRYNEAESTSNTVDLGGTYESLVSEIEKIKAL